MFYQSLHSIELNQHADVAASMGFSVYYVLNYLFDFESNKEKGDDRFMDTELSKAPGIIAPCNHDGLDLSLALDNWYREDKLVSPSYKKFVIGLSDLFYRWSSFHST